MKLSLPYINFRAHLSAIMANYDEFSDAYNAEIQLKRDEAASPEERKKYQTLKPTHRAIFKDLVMETGKRMLENIHINEKLQAEQRNDGLLKIISQSALCGDDYYVCPTNRYQMSKHNRKELSTIYRNLIRLQEAGIIVEKKNHGKKSDFDLYISAKFLIVSDKSNPEYNPLKKQPEKIENQDFPKTDNIAFCKEEKILKEHLINKINSEQSSDVITPATKTCINTGTTGTNTRTGEVLNPENQTIREKYGFKPTGGAVDIQIIKDQRGLSPVFLNKKNAPDVWHAYHRLSFSAMFIDYTIEKIYNRRGVVIIPEARLAAIEYAEKYYFPSGTTTTEPVKTIFKPCESITDYVNRLNGLKWCIDAANRYAARNNAYFMILNKYIDLQTFNGLVKTLDWFKNAKFNEKEKARHEKNRKDLRKLNELIRDVMEQQTIEAYQKADTFCENHLQKYIWVFRRVLSTVVNQIKQKNNVE